MYRFRPTQYAMKAAPISRYHAKSRHAACIQLMIMNNLDPLVAQYPHELITYGGNGAVFQNWAQYHLVMKFLSDMTDEQTLVMYSGHPLGLFPAPPGCWSPRVVITNGMVVPNYSSRELYEKFHALGCTMYGQMTAGSYCYIGPQGIVHGTTLTILGAARKYLGLGGSDVPEAPLLAGKVFVSSGLGGMSGAQPKAAIICGAVAVIAEVNPAALEKRVSQGWLMHRTSDLGETIRLIKEARASRRAVSIGYLGNAVDLWERLAREPEHLVDLGSDQTSLHNPFGGGYIPSGMSLQEAQEMQVRDPARFRQAVQDSLRRQVRAINDLASRPRSPGREFYFWDYGNSFLLEASRAGADVLAPPDSRTIYRYPSYVEDLMGDIFSLGFGPFRWVCTSGLAADLALTDRLAEEVLARLLAETPPGGGLLQAGRRQQYLDNLMWIRQADAQRLVVGSQARILYSDTAGRAQLAAAFNRAVAEGRLTAPVVLSRDHHDVSGADSPFRETSNIRDGSRFTADMAVQNFAGDAFRGATWVALHNGGGTGWGEAINGGFGLVLDGSEQADLRARQMLLWDVSNGVARRAWSGHPGANATIQDTMNATPGLQVLLPHTADDKAVEAALQQQQ